MTQGVGNTGEIGVLDNGAEFQQVPFRRSTRSSFESRQFQVAEVARIIGTPPHLIGDVSGSTSWGTGIEQQVLGWVKFTP